jgi:hypothetical protein
MNPNKEDKANCKPDANSEDDSVDIDGGSIPLAESNEEDESKPPAISASEIASESISDVKGGKKQHNKPQQRKSVKSKRNDEMPRRPLSAYNIFFREQRMVILKEREVTQQGGRSPGVNLFAQMGKTIAKRWKELPPDEFSRFDKMAQEEKARYRREMKEFNIARAKRTRLEMEAFEREMRAKETERKSSELEQEEEESLVAQRTQTDTVDSNLDSFLSSAQLNLRHYPQPVSNTSTQVQPSFAETQLSFYPSDLSTFPGMHGGQLDPFTFQANPRFLGGPTSYEALRQAADDAMLGQLRYSRGFPNENIHSQFGSLQPDNSQSDALMFRALLEQQSATQASVLNAERMRLEQASRMASFMDSQRISNQSMINSSIGSLGWNPYAQSMSTFPNSLMEPNPNAASLEQLSRLDSALYQQLSSFPPNISINASNLSALQRIDPQTAAALSRDANMRAVEEQKRNEQKGDGEDSNEQKSQAQWPWRFP